MKSLAAVIVMIPGRLLPEVANLPSASRQNLMFLGSSTSCENNAKQESKADLESHHLRHRRTSLIFGLGPKVQWNERNRKEE